VRYRQKGEEWLLTVKSDAPSPGGLAQRSEWEARVSPASSIFPTSTTRSCAAFSKRRRPTSPVFTTDFTRSFWLLTPQEGTRIEVALDRGKIVAGERQETICEVELELLEGDVADLFSAALALQAELPLHPEGASKAERGYRLARPAALAPVKAATCRWHRG
jgi:triphosphatase